MQQTEIVTTLVKRAVRSYNQTGLPSVLWRYPAFSDNKNQERITVLMDEFSGDGNERTMTILYNDREWRIDFHRDHATLQPLQKPPPELCKNHVLQADGYCTVCGQYHLKRNRYRRRTLEELKQWWMEGVKAKQAENKDKPTQPPEFYTTDLE